jgi:alginate O-acetyltransferase complex protein AlgI
VYIPLGGNRCSKTRRHTNLILTMLIGGLWHGASWNFVFWGALHGMYLMVNHFWHYLSRLFGFPKLPFIFSWMITFIAVIVAWIFFRAESFAGALIMVKGLVSYQEIILPNIVKSMLPALAKSLKSIGVQFDWIGGMNFILAWVTIILTAIIAILAPNSLQVMRNYNPTLLHNERTKELFDQFNGIYVLPGVRFSTLNMNRMSRALIAISLSWGILSIPKVSEFLYFQF